MNDSALRRLAKRYIWWDERDSMPRRRVIAQVMDLGSFEDISELIDAVGNDELTDALLNARPGWFHPPSWSYWHYRLNIVQPGDPVPPLPRRDFDLK